MRRSARTGKEPIHFRHAWQQTHHKTQLSHMQQSQNSQHQHHDYRANTCAFITFSTTTASLLTHPDTTSPPVTKVHHPGPSRPVLVNDKQLKA
ncbi:hypothetical protein HMPREF0970_01499 [Schaalia odontolytica F0309]|uniref:Uncharacterized protein n=1 Tax=Schaalia odontolytica F0309 TaxID=649742 RepID=D4TZW3_9ACTO|nr:hypothetical protein HMPREF0970_01499 [Schaalia odontolytica F0309]